MMVIITFTFCCDNLWRSEFMALEKPGKLGEFFLLLCGHPILLSIFAVLLLQPVRTDITLMMVVVVVILPQHRQWWRWRWRRRRGSKCRWSIRDGSLTWCSQGTNVIVILTISSWYCRQLSYWGTSFTALMLFVGWQEGHPACKSTVAASKTVMLGPS